MGIEYRYGNMIADADYARWIVITVNTQGIMGGGLAKDYAKHYPNQRNAYKEICDKGYTRSKYDSDNDKSIVLKGGATWVLDADTYRTHVRWHIMAATKQEVANPSRYTYALHCLEQIKEIGNRMAKKRRDIMALPLLGAGLGGLERRVVNQMTHEVLGEKDVRFNVEIWGLLGENNDYPRN